MRTRPLSHTIVVVCLAMAPALAPAQSWTIINTLPPSRVSACLLLTDGGVMCQSGAAWHKLTPDSTGSYVNGTWTSLAPFPSGYAPTDYVSAVLADGRVAVVGGEYNFGNFVLSNMGAIYDPDADSWQVILPPTDSNSDFQCLGDAPAVVLPDGRLLIGTKLNQSLAALNPGTLSWTPIFTTIKNDINAEEGWTLLPDGSVFTVDVSSAPASERLLLSATAAPNAWVSSGYTLQDLRAPEDDGPIQASGCPVYYPPGEMGPALLLPDGTVFAIGASGFTGIYTPPAPGSPATGSWAEGPALPSGLNVEDGPAALLPSGHVLFGGSPGEDGAGLQYFEFNGIGLASVPAPAGGSNDATNDTQLLVLPTGQVLFVDGSVRVQFYTPAASPAYSSAWAPAISSVAPTLNNATSYQITGTQFNGLSQGTAYGDEQQNVTNYPLVRITNGASGHVFYAKTHDHSTMGVATGNATVYTTFDVPAGIEAGPSSIEVVANGIPSPAVAVTVLTPNTGAMTIATSWLPNGQVNVPYSAALSATGGVSPYKWQLVSGTLPGGLTLNTQTGQIAGTPTSAVANARLTLTVTDSSTPTAQTASVTLSLIVTAGLTITTASLPEVETNVPYSATLSATGGTAPYSWQLIAGALPSGLTLNPQTGQISGTTATGAATMSLTFAVTDSSFPVAQAATASLSLTIAPATLTVTTASLANGQVGVPYSATLSAISGLMPYTWQLISGTLPSGLALNAQTGQISGTPLSSVDNTPLVFNVIDSSAPVQAASVTLSLTITPPTLVSIAVTPSNPTIARGLTQQFTATGTYTDSSTQNLTAQVTWASGVMGTATISSGGLASVIAASGTSSISATLGAVVGSTTLTASAPTLVSIAVTPANPTIIVGTALEFLATGTYTDGSTQNLTGQVDWVSTSAVATITAAGKAFGVKVGSTSISAMLGSIGGSTTLTLTPLGPCDVAQQGNYTVADVQAMINEALGLAPATNDLSGDGAVNVVDVQISTNAALGSGCLAGTADGSIALLK